MPKALHSGERRYSAGVWENCFFKGAGKGLLRVEAVLESDIQNRTRSQTQRHR